MFSPPVLLYDYTAYGKTLGAVKDQCFRNAMRNGV